MTIANDKKDVKEGVLKKNLLQSPVYCNKNFTCNKASLCYNEYNNLKVFEEKAATADLAGSLYREMDVTQDDDRD